MAMNLNSMILAGLIMAFILPAMAVVSLTLPNPPRYNSTENLSTVFSWTGISIYKNFNGTNNQLNQQLITGGANNSKSYSGSFYTNPGVLQAFAFIVNGLGQIMTDIVEFPYLDFVSLQFITGGMATILPGVALGFVTFGIWLLYSYMVLTILIQGISMIMKYNIQAATTG